MDLRVVLEKEEGNKGEKLIQELEKLKVMTSPLHPEGVNLRSRSQ